MKFSLLFYEAPFDFTALANADQQAYIGAWSGYIGALNKSGVMVSGAGLQPSVTAQTMRVRDGVNQVQDGPFAAAKEELGGFVVVEVPTIDEAFAWAAKCPCALHGSVEVRPVMDMGDDFGMQ